MLTRVVAAEGNGTVRLKPNASVVERKTLALNAGRTTRLR